MKITAVALTEFFEKGGQFRNKEGVVINMVGNVFTITTLLIEISGENGQYALYDEVYSAEKFLELYPVHSLNDLELLGASFLWVRYMTEGAELIFTNGDGNAIHFRKFRGNTMVFSLDLNYYTEVNKVLNMRDHFTDFIEEHIDELEAMSYKR